MSNTPWLPVIAIDLQTPPASGQSGDTYLVPQGAKGDWQDRAGQLAEWSGKKWLFIQPKNGHGVSLPDGRTFIRVNGVYTEKTAQTVSIIAGKGLTGGGRLDKDRTLELSVEALNSLKKADTSVQPGDLEKKINDVINNTVTDVRQGWYGETGGVTISKLDRWRTPRGCFFVAWAMYDNGNKQGAYGWRSLEIKKGGNFYTIARVE